MKRRNVRDGRRWIILTREKDLEVEATKEELHTMAGSELQSYLDILSHISVANEEVHAAKHLGMER